MTPSASTTAPSRACTSYALRYSWRLLRSSLCYGALCCAGGAIGLAGEQACGSLETPSCLFTPPRTHARARRQVMPVIKAVAYNFVTERCPGEVMALGINSIREVCRRIPALLEEEGMDVLVVVSHGGGRVSSCCVVVVARFSCSCVTGGCGVGRGRAESLVRYRWRCSFCLWNWWLCCVSSLP